MEEKELYNLWKKHIDSKFMYRIVSEEYLPDIKRYGFNQKRNPFNKKIKKEIYQLFDILISLKKKGFILTLNWGRPVDQEYVIRCTKKDLEKDYIDFTSKQAVKYYMGLKGGGTVNTVLSFTEELLRKKPELNKKEWNLIIKLNQWAKKKGKYQNRVILIKASSKYFETANFQSFIKEYVECPLGRFEHFKRIIQKRGLNFYKPFLTGKKLFHIRTIHPIPAREIVKIK